MHDLATIQRLNREAQVKAGKEQREKIEQTFEKLDEMLHQWENFEIADVGDFIWDWATRLTK